MPDFLLELRSEEIPARMQAKARDDLRWAFETEIRQEGSLSQGRVRTYSTPRRLVLIAEGLADATESETEEFKGPRVGAPENALEGFAKKTGVSRADLFERTDAKGVATYYAQLDKPSRPTSHVLATIIPRIIRAFPWPKSMRWGAASISTESPRWVRPLQGIVAILGEDLVPVEVGGIASGYATLGHRFHHPGPITLGGAHDYVEKLRACHVIVDPDERAALIRVKAAELARDAGLELIEDEGLVVENAGLTEWPVPLIGRFDEAFLAVPPEVIQLTARVNQKYFVCRDAEGKLANAFICTANIAASDDGAKIVEGNRKVLAARLSDARFFYDQDLKVPLDEQAAKLEKIVFHEKLGTVADKVDRVAKLARWLVEEGIVKSSPGRGGGSEADGGGSPQASTPAENPLRQADCLTPPRPGDDLATLAERAARLCKADLVTGMVGEFPELQGLMGGYYAAAQGEHPAVAEAIRDHYKPVGQGDDVPTAPVTVAVSLADKLDTIFSFFSVGEKPTGSKDPFAVRRAGLGAISLIVMNTLSIDARFVFTEIAAVFVQRLNRAHLAHLGNMLDAAKSATTSKANLADIQVAAAREIWAAHKPFDSEQIAKARYLAAEVYIFLIDRLKVQQREAGVRHDLIDAVFALGGEDDLVRLLARVRALQAFVGTGDGANLLAGYKRAANILKKEGYAAPQPTPVTPAKAGVHGPAATGADPGDERMDPRLRGGDDQGAASGEKTLSYTPEPEETALRTALDSAEPRAAAAVEAEEFEGAMAALATLRAPIDAFFDKVTVNDPDPARREARLHLLARVRDAVHRVANFSKIEG